MSKYMSQDLDQESVVFSELKASTGKIGMLRLNAEKTLNSLTLSMVDAMSEQLRHWEADENIAVIILIGSGDKAFCAGGDVQELYQSAIKSPGGPCTQGEAFFKSEYHLNYQIHSYSKPIICFGNGVVMGGGLGLMAGASHRIATESTRIAMPEITIGLFPDVGGTYFLNQMPYNFGVFFALTGASINARDALYTRLADHVIPWNTHNKLLKNLQKVNWDSSNIQNSHALVDQEIESFAIETKALHALMESEIQVHHKLLETICLKTSLSEVILEINKFDKGNHWYNKAKSAITHGSPLSSVLIYEQLRRHRYSNLETVFLSEFQLATNIIRYPEFAEGVRALLIDKDKSPKWKFKHFSDIPCHVLEHFFTAPWDSNPLKLDSKG
jgi:enoyl-CoA hydratase/carnithine racemase